MDAQHVTQLLAANARDEETQKARYAALEGKKLLWVTAPVIPGMSLIMKQAAQYAVDAGVKIYAVFESKNDKLYEIMQKEGLFCEAIFANLSDETSCTCIIGELERLGLKMDAAFSPYENCQPLVGELVDELGLPGNSAMSYNIARSKHLAREATKAAGLATPRCAVASKYEEIESVTSLVGFPCIVKPSSGAGSCGVYRANSVADAQKAFRDIEADLKADWSLSYNPGCEVGIICEQLLLGDEFDVDMLVWDGKLVYAQPVSNWPCLPPYYLETGAQMPPLYEKEKLEKLVQYSFECVKAMGFKQGCFHVESMYTTEGPVLIEVNARQGGGPNQMFNELMCGVDIFGNFLMSSCGIPINMPRREPEFAMGDYSITAPRTGILVDTSFMEHIEKHPNVVESEPLLKPGQPVKGLDTGIPNWVGQFVVKADTPEDVERIILELIHDIDAKINIEPVQKAPASKVKALSRKSSSQVSATEAA